MNNAIQLNHEETLLLLDGVLHEYRMGKRTMEIMGSADDVQQWHEAVKDLHDRLAALHGFENFESRLGFSNALPLFDLSISSPS